MGVRASETLLMFNGKDLVCVGVCSEAKRDTEKGSLRALLAGIIEAEAEGSWVQLMCSPPTTEQVVGVCTQIRRVGITSFHECSLMQFAESLSSSALLFKFRAPSTLNSVPPFTSIPATLL